MAWHKIDHVDQEIQEFPLYAYYQNISTKSEFKFHLSNLEFCVGIQRMTQTSIYEEIDENEEDEIWHIY